MRTLLIAAVSLLAAAPLPAQSPAQAGTSGTPMASVALPPELDRVLRDYERAWRAGDIDAVSQLFTPDGFVLGNGQAPVRGREGIRRAYEGQRGPLTLRALAYATGDTVGYIIGAYTYDTTAGDQGKFTVTLRRQRGGRWLIASDMDNSVRPMRRSPGAPGAPAGQQTPSPAPPALAPASPTAP